MDRQRGPNMGDFKKGEPGCVTAHRNLENDIASHNMGCTPTRHDTSAPAAEYSQNLPQAQSEVAYRELLKGKSAQPKLPETPPLLPLPIITPKAPRMSVFGFKDINYTSQLR